MLLGAKYTKSLSKLQNDMEKLRGTCVQLRTRVKEMEAALSAKTEECAHIKHEFEIKAKTLEASIQELEKNQEKTLQTIQAQTHQALNELSNELINVQKTRMQCLDQYQEKLEKDYLLTSNLHVQASKSLDNITQTVVS